MQPHTRTGMNRTGAQLSPMDVKSMQEFADMADETQSTEDMASMRGIAAAEADAVGSVPVPVSLSGAMETGVSMLKGQRPQVLIDKLGERLAFERTGTRLYQALIAKCEQMDDPDGSLLGTLNHIEHEEHEHFALVGRAIESLGADPTAQTPCADVSAVMSSGIVQVVTDPRTNLSQCLNAMLVAELADNAGWELLIKLVREAGHDDLVPGFQQAMQQEQEHLRKIGSLLESAVSADAKLV